MQSSNEHPPPQKVRLPAGAQAVINGALVTACGPCEIEVGAGGFVLTGRALDHAPSAMRSPREELYFSMLEAGVDEKRFREARFRLFGILSQVVALEKSYQGQRECSACAAALMAGDLAEAVRSSARIASQSYGAEPRGARFERRRGSRRLVDMDQDDLRA